jgi:hypothetical protein
VVLGAEATKSTFVFGYSIEQVHLNLNLNYATVFDVMLIDVIENGWKRFNMKAFLKHVARYLLGHFSDCSLVLLVSAEFVQDFAFNLVNLGIETVAMLLSDIFHVNDWLREEQFKVFDGYSLDAIVHLAPIWIKAEYCFNLWRTLKLPSHILEMVSPEVVGLVTCDYDDYQADHGATDDVALVEYSYFVSNKTMNRNLWVGDSGA